MTKLWVFLAVAVTLQAQPVQLQVIVRSPAPGYLYQWAHDPTIVQITLHNTSATSFNNAVLSFVIRRLPDGATVARSNDFHPAQPRLTIVPYSTTVLNGPQFVHESAVLIDQTARLQAQATGQLPEGQYQFCVRLLDAQGREIGSTGPICPSFIVIVPDPPMLISPRNDSTLSHGAWPLFVWAPISGTVVSVTYSLRIAPLFPNQAPLDALLYNPLVLDKRNILSTTYQYMPTDVPFSSFPTAIGFVWQVTALDPRGQPATRNNGKSEIFRFSFRATGSTNTTPISQTDQHVAPIPSGDHPGSGIQTRTIRQIALPGGFVLNLSQPIECLTAPCRGTGSGKIFIPLIQDSLDITLSSVYLSAPTHDGIAQLLSGTLTLSLGRSIPIGLMELHLRGITITHDAALADGTWVARWITWGWSCREADSVSFRSIPISVEGLPTQKFSLGSGWSCSGEGLLIGSCVSLLADSLSARVRVDTRTLERHAELNLSGLLTLSCLQEGSNPVQGRFQVRVDRGTEELLLHVRTSPNQTQILGAPSIRIAAVDWLVDLSSHANPPAFPPAGVCTLLGLSDRRWRGVYSPRARLYFAIDGDTLPAVTPVILEADGTSQRFLVSCATVDNVHDTLNAAGFRIHRDSALHVQLCQGVLVSLETRGLILLPPTIRHQPSWRELGNIRIRLRAYDGGAQWHWYGKLDCSGGLNLPIGTLAHLRLIGGTLESDPTAQIPRKGYLEFSELHLNMPATNPTSTLRFAGLRIWNTGDVEFGSSGQWQELSQLTPLQLGVLPVAVDEIGLGYSARPGALTSHWWVGISGNIEIDEKSGLPGGSAGLRLNHLQIWDDEIVTCQPSTVNFTVQGLLGLRGFVEWQRRELRAGAVDGLVGKLSATVHSLGNVNVPVEFILAGSGEQLREPLWVAHGRRIVPGGVAILPGAMHLYAGSIAAGWNIQLDSISTGLASPNPPILIPERGSALALRGSLLLADPSMQLYHYTPTFQLPLARSLIGRLEGNLTVLPASPLVHGYARGQYISSPFQTTLSLAGSAELFLPGARIDRAQLNTAFRQGTSPQIEVGPISGVWTVSSSSKPQAEPNDPILSSVVHFNNTLLRLSATRTSFLGRWSGKALIGKRIEIGSIELPHHIGIEDDTAWFVAYLYRYWREGSNYCVASRAVELLDCTAHGEYSGYPFSHFIPAIEHVVDDSAIYLDLTRHSSECAGVGCRRMPIHFQLRTLAETDVRSGVTTLSIGEEQIELPDPSQQLVEVLSGQWGQARARDVTLKVNIGSQADQAHQITSPLVHAWQDSVSASNLSQQQPPALIIASFPVQGDTAAAIDSPLRLWLGAPYRLPVWQCDSSTRCWSVSNLHVRLYELSSEGNIAREILLSISTVDGSPLVTLTPGGTAKLQPLLPATHYRLIIEGEYQSWPHGTPHQGNSVIEFRTRRTMTGLSLGAFWSGNPLPRLLLRRPDTLQFLSNGVEYPLEFGRDIWIDFQLHGHRWLWKGQTSQLVRSAHRIHTPAIHGIAIALDTTTLAAVGSSRQNLIITLLNPAKAGSQDPRPAHLQRLLEALPLELARFQCHIASDLPHTLSTAASLLSPLTMPFTPDTGIGTIAPVQLEFQLYNRGNDTIPEGIPFTCSIGLYVENSDGTRHFVVHMEERPIQLLPPESIQKFVSTQFVPSHSRLLGIRARITPLLPLVEDDGVANNTISVGELPPLGVNEP